MQLLNPFKFKIGPRANTYTKFLLYILLFIIRAGITGAIIFQKIQEIFAMSAFGIFICTALLFLLVSCTDPGYSKISRNIEFSDLFDKYRSEFVCMYCENRKSKLTRHCHYCEKCVKVINNIGI